MEGFLDSLAGEVHEGEGLEEDCVVYFGYSALEGGFFFVNGVRKKVVEGEPADVVAGFEIFSARVSQAN